MHIVVKSNPEEAMKALNTNRPIKVGDTYKGSDVGLRKLASDHPNLFELVDDPHVVKKTNKEKFGPKKNKMMDKTDSFKSKG